MRSRQFHRNYWPSSHATDSSTSEAPSPGLSCGFNPGSGNDFMSPVWTPPTHAAAPSLRSAQLSTPALAPPRVFAQSGNCCSATLGFVCSLHGPDSIASAATLALLALTSLRTFCKCTPWTFVAARFVSLDSRNPGAPKESSGVHNLVNWGYDVTLLILDFA